MLTPQETKDEILRKTPTPQRDTVRMVLDYIDKVVEAHLPVEQPEPEKPKGRAKAKDETPTE